MSADEVLEALETYCGTMRGVALEAKAGAHPVADEVYEAAGAAYGDVLEQDRALLGGGVSGLRDASARLRRRRYGFEGPEPRHAAEAAQAGERWPAALCGALVIVLEGAFDPAHPAACRVCRERAEEGA